MRLIYTRREPYPPTAFMATLLRNHLHQRSPEQRQHRLNEAQHLVITDVNSKMAGADTFRILREPLYYT